MTFAEFELELSVLIRMYNRIDGYFAKIDIMVEVVELACKYVREN